MTRQVTVFCLGQLSTANNIQRKGYHTPHATNQGKNRLPESIRNERGGAACTGNSKLVLVVNTSRAVLDREAVGFKITCKGATPITRMARGKKAISSETQDYYLGWWRLT